MLEFCGAQVRSLNVNLFLFVLARVGGGVWIGGQCNLFAILMELKNKRKNIFFKKMRSWLKCDREKDMFFLYILNSSL